MKSLSLLDRIRVVLTRPSHPGNVGATARAMKTMGLRHLVLVDPVAFPSPVADARASGAEDILATAQVVGTLPEALAGTVFSVALTARRRELSLPVVSVRAAADEAIQRASDGPVALVFGNETSGLSNAELALCQRPATIPTDAAFSSLNLAAAVQVMAYEVRIAAGAEGPLEAPQPSATFDEVERFHAHLERVLVAVEFLDPANPRRLMPRLRRLFGRSRLEPEEVAILRGFLTAVEQKTK